MGGNKKQVTYREDPDVLEYLDGLEHTNKSAILRALTAAYVRAGDAVEVGLEKRLADARSELKNKRAKKALLESDIEELQRDIETLEQRIEERRNSTPEEVLDYAEMIQSGEFPKEELTAENPGVQNQAAKAGMTPRAFVRAVEDEL